MNMKLIKSLLIALLLVQQTAYAAPQKPLIISGGKTKQIGSTDTLQLPAATTGNASVNIPHGTAPTSPTNGDVWTTTSGVSTRVNGATRELYSSGGTDVALADGGTGASLTDPNADRILFWDDSAGQTTWLSLGTNLSITGTTLDASTGAGAAMFTQPQGRLTLVTGTPVMRSNQTAKSTIYYDCYNGKYVPYYDGSNDQLDTISSCEVSLTMATSGTGVTNSGGVFDIWWVHDGANRICVATNGSGGGWASDTAGSNTARGTGYSQIHNTRGYWTNVNSITNCYNGTTDYGSISADQATYLGTIYTTAAGQTGMNFKPAAAGGGTNNILGLYNAYNRVVIKALCLDNTGSWTKTNSTWAQMNANSNNRISFVDGLGLSPVSGYAYIDIFTTANAATAGIGINYDSTSDTPTVYGRGQTNAAANVVVSIAAREVFFPSVGFHYLQAMQSNTSNVGTVTYLGTPDFQFNAELEM